MKIMKSLLIVGAGEFGHLVKELALDCGYQRIEFLDDNSSLAIGKVSDYMNFTNEYSDFTVAIGNPEVRKKIVSELEGVYNLVTLIHSKAYVSSSAHLDAGCIAEACSVINTGAHIGKCSIINAGAVVNHNSKVGDYSQVDCNAVVAADANVPDGTKVLSCSVWNKKPSAPVGDGTFF